MMKKTSGVAVALDNCAALEVVGNRYRALVSKPKANAYRVYWQKGHYVQEVIHKNLWQPLGMIGSKA
jgi:hypothetical protein